MLNYPYHLYKHDNAGVPREATWGRWVILITCIYFPIPERSVLPCQPLLLKLLNLSRQILLWADYCFL